MNRPNLRGPISVFVSALLVRILAIPLSVVEVNPYSQGDANGFEASAIHIANQLQNGVVPVVRVQYIYEVWGFLLSPFWLLPGPSAIYARLFVAVLGSTAAYNIYVIARWHHSSRAGIIAALPLMFFPSFVLVHATLLREAVVLFGLTTVARLIFVPSELTRFKKVIVIALLLGFAAVVRIDNIPVYLVIVLVWIALNYRTELGRKNISKVVVLGGVASIPFVVNILERVIEFLSMVHENRARGRTAYFEHVVPETVWEFIVFSWIGTIYFYFTPLPWMVHRPSDLVVFFEAAFNAIYGISAVGGVKFLWNRNLPATLTILTGFGLVSLFYAVGSANVGTAVRHRQMFVWVLYLFGGVYIAHRIGIRY